MTIQEFLVEIRGNTQWSDYTIARHIGVPQSYIQRLRSGTHKSCRYELGVKIHDLHSKVIGGLGKNLTPAKKETRRASTDAQN